jgi:dipeptidyl aminopeptidase/acylaminoacyl peptidase
MRWTMWIALATGLAGAGSLVAPGVVMGSASAPGTVLMVSSTPTAGVMRASLLDVATGRMRVVLRTTSLCCTGAWSPDGKWIALAKINGIELLRGDGRNPHPLPVLPLPPGSSTGDATSFGWAPDSRSLAVNEAGGHQLVIRGLDGRTRVILRTGPTTVIGTVTWSPDGRWISYDRDNLGGANGVGCCSSSLHLIHPDGSGDHTVVVTHEAEHDAPTAAVWAPGGHRFAFTTEGRNPRDPLLALVDADSGKVTRLPGAGTVALVAGTTAYVISQGLPNRLALVDTAGTRRPLATALPPSVVAASSADGTSLVIAGARTSIKGGVLTIGAADLELVDLAGGPPRVLTHLPRGSSVELLAVRPARS